MDIANWFKGFEKGIERLTAEERERFFSECGKNCVNSGVLAVYRGLYEDAQGDMDTFFLKANELNCLASGVKWWSQGGCIISVSWSVPAGYVRRGT